MIMERNKKECNNCHKLISLSNFKRHTYHCSKKKNIIRIDIYKVSDDVYQCSYCGKKFSKKGIASHVWRSHEKGVFHNPHDGYIKGSRKAYNKGLTKNNNEGVRKNSEILKEGYRTGRIKPSFLGKTHSIKTREIISSKVSLNNKGGRCKWYIVDNQKVQGTWERDLATKMSSLNIDWKKLGSNSKVFQYTLDIERSYTPDFYLSEINKYLELKGFWWGNDKEKLRLVTEQNPTLKKNLIVIEADLFESLSRLSMKEEFIQELESEAS